MMKPKYKNALCVQHSPAPSASAHFLHLMSAPLTVLLFLLYPLHSTGHPGSQAHSHQVSNRHLLASAASGSCVYRVPGGAGTGPLLRACPQLTCPQACQLNPDLCPGDPTGASGKCSAISWSEGQNVIIWDSCCRGTLPGILQDNGSVLATGGAPQASPVPSSAPQGSNSGGRSGSLTQAEKVVIGVLGSLGGFCLGALGYVCASCRLRREKLAIIYEVVFLAVRDGLTAAADQRVVEVFVRRVVDFWDRLSLLKKKTDDGFAGIWHREFEGKRAQAIYTAVFGPHPVPSDAVSQWKHQSHSQRAQSVQNAAAAVNKMIGSQTVAGWPRNDMEPDANCCQVACYCCL